jgi:hypothetical protein
MIWVFSRGARESKRSLAPLRLTSHGRGGHPSREARKQPQYIVMRYIFRELPLFCIVLRYIVTAPSQPLLLTVRLFLYRGRRCCLGNPNELLKSSFSPGDAPCLKAAQLGGFLGGHFMKSTFWIIIALLVFGAAPLRTPAQSRQSPHSQQLSNCLDEFSTCDRSTLNAQELQVVRRVTQDRNFLNCFNGFSDCDKKELNTEQQLEVAREDRDQNLQHCLDGIGECKLVRLSDHERQDVALAASVRNLQACLDGMGECDPTQLTVDQKRQLADANHDRNLQSCLEGLGECDHIQLSSQEKQDVTRATSDRNLQECFDGSNECDQSHLTAKEQREVADLNAHSKLQN